MSRAGAADGGFTLIELLVVLTIVALLAGVALPRLGRCCAPISTAPAAERGAGHPRPAQRRDAQGTMVDAHRGGVAPLLPPGTEMAEDGLGTGLVFFPNGTSTGGSDRARGGATAGARSNVDWLTGRVTVGAPP